MKTWREELAWSAGFFDGEGHIGVHIGTHSQGPQWKRHDLYLSITQTDRFVLDRFTAAVQVGRVSGPFVRSDKHRNDNDVFYFQCTRFEHVQSIVAMLWTWLSPVKRAQCIGALKMMRQRPSHQKTCKHGHEKTPENSYWSKGQRHCKPCRMAQWEKYRGRLRLA